MLIRSKSDKFFLMLLIAGAVLWLGGSIVRAAIGFDIFIPGTLDRKPFLTDAQVNYSLRLYGITAFYTLTGYGMTVLAAVWLTISLRRSLKRNGGIFMALVLLYVCLPVEVYAAVLDIKLIQASQNIPFDELMSGTYLQTLFAERLGAKMSAAGFLTLIAYSTSIVFLAWRPLTQKPENKA
jgi:hypothetical protein